MTTKQIARRINRRFKRAEDWWWKQTGWKRFGHLRRGVSCADLESPLFSLDVTTSKKLPAKLKKEMIDAEFHARGTGKTAIVAMHEEGADMMDGIVSMKVRSFFDLLVGEKKE